MVAIQQEAVTEQLALGVKKATEQSREILVSIVKKVRGCSPLSVFASAGALNINERVFWSEPNGDFQVSAIGAIHTVEAFSDDRYTEATYKWHEIKKGAIISPHSRPRGTGPLMLGGFSFDEQPVKHKLWSEFPHTKLILPVMMVSFIESEAWLTINTLVKANDDVEVKASEIMKLEQQLLLNVNEHLHRENLSILSIDEKAKEDWLNTVDFLASEMRDQLYEKVVLARELRLKLDQSIQVENVLQKLLNEQSTSHIFAFQFESDCFVGASPERLVKREGGQFLSTCLAGSTGRGTTVEIDQELGQALLNDEKNLHEHQIVVDMIRSAMEICCSEVDIPTSPILYKARDIQHLYTPVVGKAKENVSLLSVVGHLHPTPALGGYPRNVALKKIREHEALERGWYAAPIGWIDYEGNGEFIVAIRSGLIQGNEASLFAGCGLVGDSNSESEYDETRIKFRPMLSAIGGVNDAYQ
ncbi:isochorismate synthase [Bacillus solimangrovi]|uniref:isochorismate synthase n=1 Tax=Bacillus solimangrovi TaxID=1305675 RepID=A0A1E5LGE3_9BACI|nr:isochorismate synthase [Bacillus solimangrovi]OEH93142.1 hypothetical protein BFG57_13440 [Bacillus solimangrovi]